MNRRDRTIGSIAVFLLVVCCLAAVAFGGTASAQSVLVPQTDDQPAPDNTITRIDLATDGSATWDITLRTRLENDSDVAEYERFQERFRANTSRYLDPFSERMSGVVAAANESSDRDMRALAFEAETDIQEIPRRWGVVSFRFTWAGFAAVEDDAVVAGDVFVGGFFIGDADALAISAPEGYAIESAAPEPDDTSEGAVEWRGREDFDDERPSVRAVPVTAADGGSDGGGNGSSPDGDNAALLAALGGLVFLVVIGLGAYAVRSGRFALGGGEAGDGHATRNRDGGTSGGGTGDSGASDPNPSVSASSGPGSAAGSGDVDSGTDAADAVDGGTDADDESYDGDETDADDGTTAIDPDLLTDEDRVKHILDERGGRMKQSAIVEEFGWSKSKTSRVLSRMTDDGEVEKLRIGRENVIDLVDDVGET